MEETIWIVEDGEEDGIEISAKTALEAAEKYVEMGSWNEDPPYVDIYVTPLGGDEEDRESYEVSTAPAKPDPDDERWGWAVSGTSYDGVGLLEGGG